MKKSKVVFTITMKKPIWRRSFTLGKKKNPTSHFYFPLKRAQEYCSKEKRTKPLILLHENTRKIEATQSAEREWNLRKYLSPGRGQRTGTVLAKEPVAFRLESINQLAFPLPTQSLSNGDFVSVSTWSSTYTDSHHFCSTGERLQCLMHAITSALPLHHLASPFPIFILRQFC